jgi:hypothetical protein
MSQEIGNLQVTLEAQTASFDKGMASAIKSIQKMEDQIKQSNASFNKINTQFQSAASAIGVMTTALGALGGLGYLKSLMDTADAASDLADAFGVTASNVYAYQTALLAAGGKADGFEKVLQKVSSNITDAFEGSETARKGFELLGISLDQIKSKSVGETFDIIAIKLAAIEDPAKRNAVALDILGKSAIGIDWKKYANDIDGVKASYDKLEPSIRAAGQASDDLTLATKKFGLVVTSVLGDIVGGGLFAKLKRGFLDLKDVLTTDLTAQDVMLFEEMEKFGNQLTAASGKAQVLNREVKALSGTTDPFTEWTKGLQKAQIEAGLFTKKMAYLDAQMAKAVTSDQIKVIQGELEKLNGKNPFEAWKDSVDAASIQADLLVPKLEYLAELRNNDMISLQQYMSEVEKLGFTASKATDETAQMFADLQQSLAGFGQQFSSQFVDNLMAGKATMENFLNDLTKMILKFMMNQLVQKFIKGFMGAAFGAPTAGGGTSGGWFTASASSNPNESSNSRAVGDSNNGFTLGATRLSMSMASLSQSMGGMAIPSMNTSRPNGGYIQQSPMQVTINNTMSGEAVVKTAEVTNSDGTKSLQVMIERQVKELFGTGAMDKSMRASYGLVRSAL